VVIIVVDVVDIIGVVVVAIVVVLIIMQQLSLRYHDHNLKGLLLRNVLWRVVLRVLLRQHIPWCQLSNWHVSGALAGYAVRMNHLKFENRRE
jgi:hypothetical protein